VKRLILLGRIEALPKEFGDWLPKTFSGPIHASHPPTDTTGIWPCASRWHWQGLDIAQISAESIYQDWLKGGGVLPSEVYVLLFCAAEKNTNEDHIAEVIGQAAALGLRVGVIRPADSEPRTPPTQRDRTPPTQTYDANHQGETTQARWTHLLENALAYEFKIQSVRLLSLQKESLSTFFRGGEPQSSRSATKANTVQKLDRVRAFFESRLIGSLFVVAVIAVAILGFIGHLIGPISSVSDALYYTLLLYFGEGYFEPGKEYNWLLDISRLVAPILTFAGLIAMVGPLTRNMTKLYHEAWLRCGRNYVLVIGLGRCGMEVAKQYRDAEKNWIVFAIDPSASKGRIEECAAAGIDLVAGEGQDERILHQAFAHRATRIYILVSQDNAALEILDAIRSERVRRKNTKPAEIHLFLKDTAFYQQVNRRTASRDTAAALRVYPQNRHDMAAKNWWQRLLAPSRLLQDLRQTSLATTSEAIGIRQHLPLLEYSLSAPAEVRVPHFIVVGYGNMGKAITRQILRHGHWPNSDFADDETDLRPVITVIDRELDCSRFYKEVGLEPIPATRRNRRTGKPFAKLGKDYPANANRENSEVLDLASFFRFQPIRVDINNHKILEWLRKQMEDPTQLPSLVLCLDDDQTSFDMACDLNRLLGPNCKLPIFGRNVYLDGIRNYIRGETCVFEPFHNIDVFGLFDESFEEEWRSRHWLRSFAEELSSSYSSDFRPQSPGAEKPFHEMGYSDRIANLLQAEHAELKWLCREQIPPEQQVDHSHLKKIMNPFRLEDWQAPTQSWAIMEAACLDQFDDQPEQTANVKALLGLAPDNPRAVKVDLDAQFLPRVMADLFHHSKTLHAELKDAGQQKLLRYTEDEFLPWIWGTVVRQFESGLKPLAKVEHNRWAACKLLDGFHQKGDWRSFEEGQVDKAQQAHNAIVTWDALPEIRSQTATGSEVLREQAIQTKQIDPQRFSDYTHVARLGTFYQFEAPESPEK